MEAKIQEAPVIYKGIEWPRGDPTPPQKRAEDYRSAVSAY